MKPTITMYTRPGCGPCVATKRHLEKVGLEHTTINTAQDSEARDYLIARGFRESPVVIATVGDQEFAWSGYRADEIAALSYVIKETQAA